MQSSSTFYRFFVDRGFTSLDEFVPDIGSPSHRFTNQQGQLLLVTSYSNGGKQQLAADAIRQQNEFWLTPFSETLFDCCRPA